MPPVTTKFTSRELSDFSEFFHTFTHPFQVWQIVLNSLYFGFALAFAVCYTVLAVLSTTFSYDYFATCVWSWVDIVVLFYLLVSSARKKIDYTFEPNYTGTFMTISICSLLYQLIEPQDVIIARECYQPSCFQ